MKGLLFDVESNTITYHLGEIYKSGELEQIWTTRKNRVVQQGGSRNVNREIEHYNLDAIIFVGYRVNSIKATQFRRWTTQVLSRYTQKGYVIDRKRIENGTFLDEDYFEELFWGFCNGDIPQSDHLEKYMRATRITSSFDFFQSVDKF